MISNKKFKVTFLIHENNSWFTKALKTKIKNNKKYKIKFSKSIKYVFKQDIVFFINLTKIVKEQFLKNNKLNLVIHASDLPKNKGGAPLQWQILKGKKIITICLFEAKKDVDAGDIIMKTKVKYDGSELNQELREKQSKEMIKLIKNFLNKYPNFKKKKQLGRSTVNRIRNPKDSELNINRSIKSQFNLMRIADNEKYPLFFKFKKNKYFLKIFKKKI